MRHRKKLLWQQLLVTLVGVLLFCATSNAQTVPQIAEKALATTVSLEMQDKNGVLLGRGSGFFVRHDLIAANYHVIEGAAQGTVKLVGKETKYTIEGFTATDKTNDLALLKVTVYGIKPLPLGDSDTVRVGETIYVAGNPIGLEGTISHGIISGRRDRYTKERLQMTVPISPGSSGGPVLNSKGKVIGVSVSGYHGLGVQNLNFVIPSNYLKTLLTQSGTVKPLSQQNQSISAETHLYRGNDKYKSGDYEGAIADYTQAIRLKPDYADAYNNRGIAKDDLGQYLAAIADYDTAIRLKPDYADTYNNRGIVKARLGQHLDAIADYNTAIRLKSDYADAYVNRGNAKARLGQHLAAIADYDTAIRFKPNYADTYNNRGIVKARLGQHLAAIADYDTAIRLKPNYADTYNNRGAVKDDLRQHLAAIADYDTAIRLKPDYADTYNNRGNAKASLRQHLAAIADYDTAIRLKPDHARAYASRGLPKARLGQHLAAIADYDTAIRLKPNHADAYYYRAVSKTMLERLWEARQDLRTALKLAEQTGDESLKTDITELINIINEME